MSDNGFKAGVWSVIVAVVTSVATGFFVVKEQPVVSPDTAGKFLDHHYDGANSVFSDDDAVLNEIWSNNFTDNFKRSTFNEDYNQFYSRYHERFTKIQVGRVQKLEDVNNVFQVQTTTTTSDRKDRAAGQKEYTYYLTCKNWLARFSPYTCPENDVQLDAATLVVRE